MSVLSYLSVVLLNVNNIKFWLNSIKNKLKHFVHPTINNNVIANANYSKIQTKYKNLIADNICLFVLGFILIPNVFGWSI